MLYASHSTNVRENVQCMIAFSAKRFLSGIFDVYQMILIMLEPQLFIH